MQLAYDEACMMNKTEGIHATKHSQYRACVKTNIPKHKDYARKHEGQRNERIVTKKV